MWPAGDVLLAASLAMLAVTSLYPTTIYWLSRQRSPCRAKAGRGSLGLVIAAYEEPLWLLERLLRNCTGGFDRIIIVWDGAGADDARRLAESVLGERLVFISRPRGMGKANALNTALQRLDTDYAVILDIDDCLRGHPRRLTGCDSVVGYWLPGPGRMLTEALGEALAFASRVLYAGRCRLGRPVFFLGSGSSVKRSVAAGLGGWSEEAILEDVEFGLRLLASGRRVCFSEDAVIEIGVPPSYRGFRLQQARWARGAVQLLTRKPGLVLRAAGLEGLLYLSNYVLIGLWQPLLVAGVLLGATPWAALVYLITASLLLAAAGHTYTHFLVRERGHSYGRALRLAAASTAVSACLTPVLVAAIVEGVVGRRVWHRTPKTRTGGGLATMLPEFAYAALTVYAALHAVATGLMVYPLLVLHALAPVYVALRFRRQLG